MRVTRKTKHFAELTTSQFEFDGKIYGGKRGNFAIDDETGKGKHFDDKDLIVELDIQY